MGVGIPAALELRLNRDAEHVREGFEVAFRVVVFEGVVILQYRKDHLSERTQVRLEGLRSADVKTSRKRRAISCGGLPYAPQPKAERTRLESVLTRPVVTIV